jgi:hypothetical protein
MSASRQSRAALFAAAFGIGLLAAPAAQAFSLQDSNGSTADPRQGYLNLDTPSAQTDKPAAGFGSSGTSTVEQGGVTLQFGRQRSFDEKFNADRYFDPLRMR